MYQNDVSVMVICSVPFLGGLLSLAFNFYLGGLLTDDVAPKGKGEDDLQVIINGIVKSGAVAFLKEEYKVLAPFVICMAIFFFIEEGITCANGSAVYAGQCSRADSTSTSWAGEFPGRAGWRLSICFIVGATLSAAAGWAGMQVATDTNVKAANAALLGNESEAKDGLNRALKVAFAGGAVMGFTVVGLGLTGLTVLSWLFAEGWESQATDDALTLQLENTKMSLVRIR